MIEVARKVYETWLLFIASHLMWFSSMDLQPSFLAVEGQLLVCVWILNARQYYLPTAVVVSIIIHLSLCLQASMKEELLERGFVVCDIVPFDGNSRS